MENDMYRIFASPRALALATLVLASIASSPAGAQEFSRLDGYLVDTPALVAGFGSGALEVRLTGTTPDTELAGYAALVREKGRHALLSALGGRDLGSVSIDNGLGRPIAIVQETREEGLRRVLLIVPRDLSPREVFNHSRLYDYPYYVIDATLDADGYGLGDLYPAVKLEISPDGKLSYESLAPLPMRILHLRAS